MLRLSLLFSSVHRKSGRWWHLFSRVSRPRWVACPSFFFFFFLLVAFHRYTWNIYRFSRIKHRSPWIRSSGTDDFITFFFFCFFLCCSTLWFTETGDTPAGYCAYTDRRQTTVPPGTNDLIDSARNPWRTFHLAASSGAYWLMPFLSKWSSIYLPLDDQISGFSYFLGPRQALISCCDGAFAVPPPPLTSPYWKSHLIPTKTLLRPLNQGHKSHLRAALWSAKQKAYGNDTTSMFPVSLPPLRTPAQR